jgi:hypothetical protein
MPNTANYSFPTPADTDLVKNGADAIRDLGDAVDTAMNTALGTKKSGLVLLNTTSFSGVTSQSVNDVFSATYDIYYILTNIDAPGSANLTFRLRASGSDLSSSVYTNQTLSATNTSISASRSTGTSGNLGSLRGKDLAVQMLIANPFRTVEKSCIVQQTDFSGSNVTGTELNDARVGIDSALSYTGFTIISSVASYLTGKVSVYGYNL